MPIIVEAEIDDTLDEDAFGHIETPGVSPVQRRQFKAGVDLDAKRPADRHWGLIPWYREWCAQAKPGWLDPLGGDWGLMRLEDNLRKFQGDQKALRPILAILRRLTRAGVSPAAFLRYAVLTRVCFDFDWRSWDRLHRLALEAMAETVIRLSGAPPFDQPLGGSRQINPEVVLVKYTLRPLARMPQSQLEDQAQIEAYVAAWQRLKLDHPMVIYFLRRNVFPFLAAQSGRIDLVQLTSMVEALTALEESFRRRYPESLYGEALQKQADTILIYGPDVEEALRIRRSRGMTDIALIRELRLYLRLLGRLLSRESGLYLAHFLSQILQETTGNDEGERIERLLDLIGPAEGVWVYQWHVRRLHALPGVQQEAYLDLVRHNGGVDPEFRRARDVFREVPDEGGRNAEDLAKTLGLPLTVSGPRSATQILAAYIALHGELAPEYQLWKEDIFWGRDRGWGPYRFPGLDGQGQALHQLLLRSTIRGLGGTYSRVKSKSYEDLWNQFSKASQAPSFEARQELTLEVSAPPTPSGDPEIRRSLHLDFLAGHWQRLQEPAQAPDAAATLFLHQSLQYREAGDKLLSQAQDPQLSEKERTKLEQQSRLVRTRAENLERVMEAYPKLTVDLQRLTALIVGAQTLKSPEVLISLLLAPYRETPEFQDRLRYLRSDLKIEIVTLDQLGWIQNLWDTVFAMVRGDRGLHRAFRGITMVQDILEPYILTKKKVMSWEALDAAVRTIAQYTRLTGERSKWQSLWERKSKSATTKRTFVVAASKAPLDAYYGDMGGICLSDRPQAILHPKFHVLRLFDAEKQQIVGEAILVLNTRPILSFDPSRPVWFFFALNPLRSILRSFGSEQQLELYFTFRALAVQIAQATRFPLVIPGYLTPGIVSNDGHFAELISTWEIRHGAVAVNDARGFELFYSESCYARALVIHA